MTENLYYNNFIRSEIGEPEVSGVISGKSRIVFLVFQKTFL